MKISVLHNRMAILFCQFLLIMFMSANIRAEGSMDADITEPVTALHNALLNNMKQGDELDFKQRYQLLEPVVTTRFDTPLIVKVVLGRYWKTLDEQAQDDFIDLFNQLTIATYANRFDAFTDEHFQTVAIEAMKKERKLVKTELQSADEESVSLDYIVQDDQGVWKIISVIANGVNDLSLKRAEYGAVIKDKGIDNLVDNIKAKIDDLGMEE